MPEQGVSLCGRTKHWLRKTGDQNSPSTWSEDRTREAFDRTRTQVRHATMHRIHARL